MNENERINQLIDIPSVVGPELAHKSIGQLVEKNHERLNALNLKFEPHVKKTIDNAIQKVLSYNKKHLKELADKLAGQIQEIHEADKMQTQISIELREEIEVMKPKLEIDYLGMFRKMEKGINKKLEKANTELKKLIGDCRDDMTRKVADLNESSDRA